MSPGFGRGEKKKPKGEKIKRRKKARRRCVCSPRKSGGKERAAEDRGGRRRRGPAGPPGHLRAGIRVVPLRGGPERLRSAPRPPGRARRIIPRGPGGPAGLAMVCAPRGE